MCSFFLYWWASVYRVVSSFTIGSFSVFLIPSYFINHNVVKMHLNIMDWRLFTFLMFNLEFMFQIYDPYVQIGFIILLWISSLLLIFNLEFLSMSQYMLFLVIFIYLIFSCMCFFSLIYYPSKTEIFNRICSRNFWVFSIKTSV